MRETHEFLNSTEQSAKRIEIFLRDQMAKSTLHSLTLCIGEIPVLLFSENREFMAQTEERYTNFISTGMDPLLRIDVNVLPKERAPNLATEMERPEVVFDHGTERGTFAWPGLSGEIDLVSRKARMSCTLSPIALNSFLRFTYSLVLLKEPGFLVHASGLVRNQKGYIFPGKSGVGKTTIARLSPGATLLSDDIPLVKIVDIPLIFGTPFWGGLAVGGEKTSAPLAGIYFPVKDKKNYAERLKPRQVFERLLPNVIFFFRNEKFSKQLVNLSFELATKVAGYELHFLPDSSFWECIDA
jgi:hypothetical protein